MWECDEERQSLKGGFLRIEVDWFDNNEERTSPGALSGLAAEYVDTSRPMAAWRCAMPSTHTASSLFVFSSLDPPPLSGFSFAEGGLNHTSSS